MSEKEWDTWYTANRDALLLRSNQLQRDSQRIIQQASTLGVAENAEVNAFASMMKFNAELLEGMRNFLEQMNVHYKKIYSLDAQMGEAAKALNGLNTWKKDYAQPILDEAQKDYGNKLGRVTKLDDPQ